MRTPPGLKVQHTNHPALLPTWIMLMALGGLLVFFLWSLGTFDRPPPELPHFEDWPMMEKIR